MMKKILTSLICLVALAASAQQEDEKGHFKWPNGLRGGVQWSSLHKAGGGSEGTIAGYYAGYLRRVHLIPFIRLETGMEYMQAGAYLENNTKMKLHYLVLPAQLVAKLGPVFLTGGASANVLLHEDLFVNGEKQGGNKANFFDLAADGGVGLSFLFVAIEFRYYYGLVNVQNDYHNQHLQLGVKLHF